MIYNDSVSAIKIFYSYSHADANLRDELDKHLSTLKRNGIIDDWSDGEITPGTPWEEQILEKLANADVILLLVSSDFLASDFINEVELERAIARHESGDVRVIPIILRPCDWQGLPETCPMGALQALPKDALAITSWDAYLSHNATNIIYNYYD